MVLEILCFEPIYTQYSGVLETCLTLRYWFLEVLGSERIKLALVCLCSGLFSKVTGCLSIVMLSLSAHVLSSVNEFDESCPVSIFQDHTFFL